VGAAFWSPHRFLSLAKPVSFFLPKERNGGKQYALCMCGYRPVQRPD